MALLQKTADELGVSVNPRFGTWNPETVSVEPRNPERLSSPAGGVHRNRQRSTSLVRVRRAGPALLLVTTHRVAPGLLTRSAWQVLDEADSRFARPQHPLLPALADAGLAVATENPDPPAGPCPNAARRR